MKSASEQQTICRNEQQLKVCHLENLFPQLKEDLVMKLGQENNTITILAAL